MKRGARSIRKSVTGNAFGFGVAHIVEKETVALIQAEMSRSIKWREVCNLAAVHHGSIPLAGKKVSSKTFHGAKARGFEFPQPAWGRRNLGRGSEKRPKEETSVTCDVQKKGRGTIPQIT